MKPHPKELKAAVFDAQRAYDRAVKADACASNGADPNCRTCEGYGWHDDGFLGDQQACACAKHPHREVLPL
jgi:hypothetical protein